MAQNDSQKLVHFSGALFLTIAAIFVGVQLFMPPWFKNVRAEITQQPYARTISVNGEAKLSAKPDMAVVSLSVVSQATTVKDILADNNTKMTKVIEEIKNLGIEAKDITTSQYNLYPEYDYSKDVNRMIATPGKLIGYRLNQEITVKVRDLEKVEDVLDKATQVGANQVGQLYFDIDDSSELKKQVRELAFKAAQEKAEQMAKAAGVKLGQVVTFSEGGDFYQPYANIAMDVKTEAATGGGPSIEPGSKEIRLNVSVTYEIQ